ncbi:phage shock protein A (PspA) family protein [Tenacibaculum skagerrakense]|uniref:Phage shock protein A (PspA) family protein n=1 Tax=Tenacibaculum skagerrakense TaxID=186571 RepID=A0A4R2NZL7_9FLAO|nr:PspA/IM30 family protein [Tenacibaculum skagerrakense]TCP26981.1 phage shock protein A (PspA) family protein [Tenacibaculum skagerrakense]
MNLFKRLFKIGQAEANAALDSMEDPIKMTEQGIRDLKIDLEKSLESLAQVKALAIRAKNDVEEFSSKANDYQQKAMLILTKAKNGEIAIEEADKLAKQALVRKEETNQQLENAKSESESFDESVAKLESSVQEIKNSLKKWENELRTLKARHKVAKATKSLNKEMAEIDSSSTVAMLERMKSKIEQEEALADAYGNIAKENKTFEQKLDELTNTTEQSADDDLAALKKEMGLND